MTDYLTIVRAVYSGLSQRQVATTHRVSRNTVALLVRYAQNQGWLTLEDLNHLDNHVFSAALEKGTSPSRDVTFRMPDFEYVHSELAKPHVTLKLLWEEYVERCQQSSDRFYMETQFRRYYHKFARVHKATIRLEHKPALSLEVDWAVVSIVFRTFVFRLAAGRQPAVGSMLTSPRRSKESRCFILRYILLPQSESSI